MVSPEQSDVVLVHGWGGSYTETWQEPGISALLEDAGHRVIGVDLLGHGGAPRPHDPEAYRDLTDRILEVLPNRPVAAVGFSLGAMTLLRLAIARPDRFSRLVLAGIGDNVLHPEDHSAAIVEALRSGDAGDDRMAGVFLQYAQRPGNDPLALAAVMARPRQEPVTATDLARLHMPVLVVVGDQDFVGDAQELVAALPNGHHRVLVRTDHFATPGSFGFIDSMLDFLASETA